MLRKVLGALAGIATAVLTVMLMQWLSHIIYPLPDGLEVTNSGAMSAHIAAAPVAALLLVLAGYLIATFDGTFVACLIGRAPPYIYALLIGVLMLAGTASDLMREERRRPLAEAIASLERALKFGPPYGHAEDPEMSRKNIEERLLEWHIELQEI